MSEELEGDCRRARDEIAACPDAASLEALRVRWLGRRGPLSQALRGIGELPAAQRKAAGERLNALRRELEEAARQAGERLAAGARPAGGLDVTAPGRGPVAGGLHPLSRLIEEVEEIFLSLGFSVLEGPEVESERYNFEALNIPADHPARDLQDTIWLESGLLMRTHTSPVQIRAMERFAPPLRTVAIGRCFRYEAVDAAHDHTFHQLEGLMIDAEISVANLIAVMMTFLGQLFGREVKVRLRPAYFPFVEPGFELDFACLVCGEKGCAFCKHTGWKEMLGCGLVHPNVLQSGGVDPAAWSGFAFGMGLERLAMMRYGIDDIRLFHGGDLRFLEQFR